MTANQQYFAGSHYWAWPGSDHHDASMLYLSPHQGTLGVTRESTKKATYLKYAHVLEVVLDMDENYEPITKAPGQFKPPNDLVLVLSAFDKAATLCPHLNRSLKDGDQDEPDPPAMTKSAKAMVKAIVAHLARPPALERIHYEEEMPDDGPTRALYANLISFTLIRAGWAHDKGLPHSL